VKGGVKMSQEDRPKLEGLALGGFVGERSLAEAILRETFRESDPKDTKDEIEGKAEKALATAIAKGVPFCLCLVGALHQKQAILYIRPSTENVSLAELMKQVDKTMGVIREPIVVERMPTRGG
jgi:hypothetical protein